MIIDPNNISRLNNLIRLSQIPTTWSYKSLLTIAGQSQSVLLELAGDSQERDRAVEPD